MKGIVSSSGYKPVSINGVCRVYQVEINIVISIHLLKLLRLEPLTWNRSV